MLMQETGITVADTQRGHSRETWLLYTFIKVKKGETGKSKIQRGWALKMENLRQTAHTNTWYGAKTEKVRLCCCECACVCIYSKCMCMPCHWEPGGLGVILLYKSSVWQLPLTVIPSLIAATVSHSLHISVAQTEVRPPVHRASFWMEILHRCFYEMLSLL